MICDWTSNICENCKVSKLEQDLQKQKEISAEKLRKMEEKCELATHEADLKRQKIVELTGTAR